MDHKFKRLLEELSDFAPSQERDRDLFIESRAMQVIASFTNLMKLITETYDSETAGDLQKRLINASRTGDQEKFRRKIKHIREAKIKNEERK